MKNIELNENETKHLISALETFISLDDCCSMSCPKDLKTCAQCEERLKLILEKLLSNA